MKNLPVLVVAASLLTVPAWADVPSGPAPGKPSAPLPRSIWKLQDDGTLRHLQSELTCPAAVSDFRRIDARVYDRQGLDVSCNYLSPEHSLITIYLTRRKAGSVDEAFREAQRELLQVTPDAAPLPDDGQKTFSSEPGWKHLIYVEKKGAIHSGIWVRDMDGWTLEYRATYSPADEQPVLGEMQRLTEGADASAGTHLHLCAMTGVPPRDGMPVNDGKQASAFTLAALTHMSVGKQADSVVGPDASATPPARWCVEPPADAAAPVLAWHGLDDKGNDAGWDRATLLTLEDPLVLESMPDDFVTKVASELEKTAPPARIYELRIQNGSRTFIFGLYRGRPGVAALTGMLSDIAGRKAQPEGSVDSATHTINFNPDKPR